MKFRLINANQKHKQTSLPFWSQHWESQNSLLIYSINDVLSAVIQAKATIWNIFVNYCYINIFIHSDGRSAILDRPEASSNDSVIGTIKIRVCIICLVFIFFLKLTFSMFTRIYKVYWKGNIHLKKLYKSQPLSVEWRNKTENLK